MKIKLIIILLCLISAGVAGKLSAEFPKAKKVTSTEAIVNAQADSKNVTLSKVSGTEK